MPDCGIGVERREARNGIGAWPGIALAAGLLYGMAGAGPSAEGISFREYPVMREDAGGRQPDPMAGLPGNADTVFRRLLRMEETERVRGLSASPAPDGKDPLVLEIEAAQAPGNDSVGYVLKQGDRIVFRVKEYYPAGDPIRNLFVHDGKWHLEIKDRFFVDGRDWKREKGLDELFNARIFGGRTSWFARAVGGKQVRLYQGGKPVGKGYDRIVHDQCCAASIGNILNRSREMGFFGLRGGMWYFVVARA